MLVFQTRVCYKIDYFERLADEPTIQIIGQNVESTLPVTNTKGNYVSKQSVYSGESLQQA